jgi:hypothetical protein
MNRISSLPVTAMASTSKKRSAVLRDDELECLLLSDSEQSSSESDFDTENELEDRAVLDTVRNEDSDEDDRVTQDSFGRLWKTIGDNGKISRGVLDLKVLQ